MRPQYLASRDGKDFYILPITRRVARVYAPLNGTIYFFVPNHELPEPVTMAKLDWEKNNMTFGSLR